MRMTSFADRRMAPRRAPMPLIAALNRLFARRKERRALLALDDHLLKDVGLTRDQAAREAARPIWDAPDIWRR